eukprot:CAMPEP_0174316608 /NCGR_PEP_ID=MMETSP0810-20121108/7049_1 /TAXON_ID=73025 ORGANISM="Eutreptiella gymnastica-like, Strain CCMP1594" /NCGR_SAMPLE_ID=MMETSP0810 /ASSEMBLY_ACC=CAM_ASM_000659 /LENGTH=65 /DNA_ID=CAMNT_0015426349 /DNA_START=1663 /DNA_END=1856 /DNA_ORIENTATION=-
MSTEHGVQWTKVGGGQVDTYIGQSKPPRDTNWPLWGTSHRMFWMTGCKINDLNTKEVVLMHCIRT